LPSDGKKLPLYCNKQKRIFKFSTYKVYLEAICISYISSYQEELSELFVGANTALWPKAGKTMPTTDKFMNWLIISVQSKLLTDRL
jgi:hypothetical protein